MSSPIPEERLLTLRRITPLDFPTRDSSSACSANPAYQSSGLTPPVGAVPAGSREGIALSDELLDPDVEEHPQFVLQLGGDRC